MTPTHCESLWCSTSALDSRLEQRRRQTECRPSESVTVNDTPVGSTSFPGRSLPSSDPMSVVPTIEVTLNVRNSFISCQCRTSWDPIVSWDYPCVAKEDGPCDHQSPRGGRTPDLTGGDYEEGESGPPWLSPLVDTRPNSWADTLTPPAIARPYG